MLQDGDALLLLSDVTHLLPHKGATWPCFSLVPASNELKDRSISKSSGDVEREELADVVVSGLEALDNGCELLSDEELSVPLVLVLSVHELPDGELGKDTEDSLVVVSDTGCELAG